MGINNILVLRLDRLGDFILTLPAIKVLKDNLPKAKLFILVEPFLKELAESFSFIDNVVVYNTNTSLLDKLTFFSTLRKQKFDLAIDFMYAPHIKPAFLTFLSGAKKRVGFGIGLRSIFFTQLIPRTKKLKYEGERHLDIIRELGLPLSSERFKMGVDQEVLKNIKKKFQLKKSKSKPIICLHPGVYEGDKRRLWSTEKFAQLADRLIKKYKAQIIITGKENERDLADEIVQKSKHAQSIINLAGKTDILELCAVISLCDVVVCTLTSVTHISHFLGKQTITLCGPTPYKRWTGEGYSVIRKELPCSPCEHLSSCSKETNICMENISVEDVLNKIKK